MARAKTKEELETNAKVGVYLFYNNYYGIE